MAAPRTIVYIDGFNFYYGSIRGTPWRWLDLLGFARSMLRHNDVIAVKYFTALVKSAAKDPQKSIRQQAYLRALRTIPEVEIFLGSFQAHPVRRPLADGTGSALVIDMKEKGSDVNLATHLLVDGYERKYEVAVVVSNDSDLVAPISMIRNRLGCAVGAINPHRKASFELSKCCSFIKPVRKWALEQNQLPTSIRDANGEIHKPDVW